VRAYFADDALVLTAHRFDLLSGEKFADFI
jgi:hypothetical protein